MLCVVIDYLKLILFKIFSDSPLNFPLYFHVISCLMKQKTSLLFLPYFKCMGGGGCLITITGLKKKKLPTTWVTHTQ